MPASSFGFFLTSLTQADVSSVPGSVGRFCLGGAIGRFVGPGQVQNAGLEGTFYLELDLAAFPDPQVGAVPVQSGDTWSFQAWHSDTAAAGVPTSNFTPALAVTFQ
ncbi:hypothetical protein Poly30_29350 [Planctomycetes bacterium Poly30]|uniref:Uncharacterized protein n=1 Tax=Saltatorellus ferox TaxID=2528018 RepID=A0A518ETJ8_9BACT|nr:hypothetical protein Poly30_29350 [Planctomycetes bacterium Poly30]